MPKAPRQRSVRSYKGSPHNKLYNTGAWKSQSKAFKERHPFCTLCACRGRYSVTELVCDHIEQHSGDLGLFWCEENRQTLCKRCHDSDKHKHENRKLGRKAWFEFLRKEMRRCRTRSFVEGLACVMPEHVRREIL